MKTDVIKRPGKYDIPYVAQIDGREEKAVIVIHGFGSSKDSPTAQMLLRELPRRNMGVLAFDFPAHGDSPADGEMLRLGNCLDDLQAAEQFLRERLPGAQLYYFGSSFGAYIALNYITEREHEGKKAFLRSAAVNMPDLFRTPTPEQAERLKKYGYVLLDYGNERPLKVTWAFIEDLWSHDLFESFHAGGAELKMIHGCSDETILYERAKAFAEKFNIDIISLAGGDHRLSLPGMPERVLEEAVGFFA